MGRIFEVRKHAMFARWDRMAKQFARIGKDITIAVKAGGPTRTATRRCGACIQNARAVNMPKDKVEAAIKRASGQDAANYEEIIYEGYAPHGIAVLVETATDNPTRTVANVRTHFNKHGGNMGTTGSVAFKFKRMGVFRLNPEGIDPGRPRARPDRSRSRGDGREHRRERRAAAGRRAARSTTSARCRTRSRSAASRRSRRSTSTSARRRPSCPRTQANEVLELVDKLEQDDDVQKVYHTLA